MDGGKLVKKVRFDLGIDRGQTETPRLDIFQMDHVVNNILGHLRGMCTFKEFLNFRTVNSLWNKEVFINSKIVLNLQKMVEKLHDANELCDLLLKVKRVRIRGECATVNNDKLVSWLKIYGEKVNFLEYDSELICEHQTLFLEQILRKWCVNISELMLTRVTCPIRFFEISNFNSAEINCSVLKTLKIKMEPCKLFQFAMPCKRWFLEKKISAAQFRSDRMSKYSEVVRFSEYWYSFMCEIWKRKEGRDIVRYLEAFHEFPQQCKLQCRCRKHNYLNSDQVPSLHNVDGGIFSKLLSNSPIETLILEGIKGADLGIPLVLNLKCRKNKLATTLQNLSITHLPINSIGEKADNGMTTYSLSLMQLPVTRLSLGCIFDSCEMDSLQRFIGSLHTTLEGLSFRYVPGSFRDNECKLLLPKLPFLKSFTNENMVGLQMNLKNILTSCPMLFRMHIMFNQLSFEKDANTAMDKFLFDDNETSAPVNTLKILTVGCRLSARQLNTLLVGLFPKLEGIELELQKGVSFTTLINNLNTETVQDLHFKFSSYGIVFKTDDLLKLANAKRLYVICMWDQSRRRNAVPYHFIKALSKINRLQHVTLVGMKFQIPGYVKPVESRYHRYKDLVSMVKNIN